MSFDAFKCEVAGFLLGAACGGKAIAGGETLTCAETFNQARLEDLAYLAYYYGHGGLLKLGQEALNNMRAL